MITSISDSVYKIKKIVLVILEKPHQKGRTDHLLYCSDALFNVSIHERVLGL